MTMTKEEIVLAIESWPIRGDEPPRDILSLLAGEAFEWRKWAKEIPFIKWPSGWLIKAVPPYGGAVIRYLIKKPDGQEISVYLDCYCSLGFFTEPYWEAYPINGDTFRCGLNEIYELIDAIENSKEEPAE